MIDLGGAQRNLKAAHTTVKKTRPKHGWLKTAAAYAATADRIDSVAREKALAEVKTEAKTSGDESSRRTDAAAVDKKATTVSQESSCCSAT